MIEKIVLTGPSGAGKTTLINELANRGYMTIKESPRVVLENYQNDEWAHLNRHQMQREMLELQLSQEESFVENFSPGGTPEFDLGPATKPLVFIDRGVPDILGYGAYYLNSTPGLASNTHRLANLHRRYDQVLEIRPFSNKHSSDLSARIEDSTQEVAQAWASVERMYQIFGYKMKVVPPSDNVQLRADYLIDLVEGPVKPRHLFG